MDAVGQAKGLPAHPTGVWTMYLETVEIPATTREPDHTWDKTADALAAKAGKAVVLNESREVAGYPYKTDDDKAAMTAMVSGIRAAMGRLHPEFTVRQSRREARGRVFVSVWVVDKIRRPRKPRTEAETTTE